MLLCNCRAKVRKKAQSQKTLRHFLYISIGNLLYVNLLNLAVAHLYNVDALLESVDASTSY